MNWINRIGTIHYEGNGNFPIDMSSVPAIDEKVRLKMDDYEFDVVIKGIDGDLYNGIVEIIGPSSTLEACGIKRGDNVSFHEKHIHMLYRK